MKPEDLTTEQKEIKLTDEQLEAASGGIGGSSPADVDFACPQCESTNVWIGYRSFEEYIHCRCNDCGYKWEIPYYPG